MAGVFKGKNLRVYVSTEPIGFATSGTFSVSRSLLETLHKDNTNSWREVETDQISATLTVDALYSNDTTIDGNNRYSTNELYDALVNGTQLTIIYQNTGDATSRAYSCPAYCTDFSVTATNNENATYSATFEVNGAITTGLAS